MRRHVSLKCKELNPQDISAEVSNILAKKSRFYRRRIYLVYWRMQSVHLPQHHCRRYASLPLWRQIRERIRLTSADSGTYISRTYEHATDVGLSFYFAGRNKFNISLMMSVGIQRKIPVNCWKIKCWSHLLYWHIYRSTSY